MKIALCVKQVPDTNDIKWTENNTMQREGVESILNPCDACATELALKLKKKYNAEITAFTMGPLQAEKILKLLIARGIDNAVLLSDKKIAGADTYATAKTISQAIKKVLPDFDIILCGQYAIDGDTAQTGPCIAEFLNIPQVTYTQNIDKIEDNKMTLTREISNSVQTILVQNPSLCCILDNNIEYTRPKINDIIKSQTAQIKVLSLNDLGLNENEAGLKGSLTYVSKAFKPENKHNCTIYDKNGATVLYEILKGVK